MRLEVGKFYGVKGENTRFKCKGVHVRNGHNALVEFSEEYNNGRFSGPLDVSEIKYVIDSNLYHLLEKGKKYHTCSIESETYRLIQIKNTKLSRKLYPNYKVNGDWLIVGVENE